MDGKKSGQGSLFDLHLESRGSDSVCAGVWEKDMTTCPQCSLLSMCEQHCQFCQERIEVSDTHTCAHTASLLLKIGSPLPCSVSSP